MDKDKQEISELILPELKERKDFLVYSKIVFFPILLYLFFVAGYFSYIDFKVELRDLILMGVILFIALFFARHNAEYASCIFWQQKDEFKQALKRYIMKNFLSIGKETKSNASFDDFAYTYIRFNRNENFASIAPSSFAVMGILGTFISIALSMPSFKGSDLSSFELALSEFLSSISTAFYVSIYGIFLALWWVFFEKFGQSKIQKLLDRQKSSTSGFFWSKEELEQRYLTQGLKHFEKIAVIFEQVSNEEFFKELDHSIERKFGLFQEMLNVEEKAIRVSSEHIKQTMSELNRAHRNQKDLSKIYLEMTTNINTLNQNLKEITARMSEQYNRLLDVSSEKTQHLDRTLLSLDEKIENFKRNFEHYQDLMLENQEKIFIGFKNSLLQGMREFKEVYEEERSIDDKIEMMSQLKAEMNELDNEASEVIAKLNKNSEEK
ncbi:hypothetical protein CQA38_04710 [Campylobacter sp. MIT 12-5580]|uniref:MotA/TolQ/ExbB proton channel family protein n=1 Tax=unclassified Campylobacter TaxID=2593542 RepID=UPI0010F4E7DD|nr:MULTISPECIES: MotA/TolQ/ExbB proton channel family protein [unclassified Campylobacter]NDJ26416.1 hypothetical protein [Campylobacter sp. MIT 19-121]TKX29386.1 hypothetical protein CQA38_04710 [Campylobacter sp. MIT 12-5580]